MFDKPGPIWYTLYVVAAIAVVSLLAYAFINHPPH